MKKNLIFAVAIAMLSLTGGFTGAYFYNQNHIAATQTASESGTIPTTQTLAKSSLAPEMSVDFTNAASLTVHSVVHVKTYFDASPYQGSYYSNPFYDFFYGNPRQMPDNDSPRGTGSGVIISEDGYIVTNNHVVEKADKVEVTLNDKRTYSAKIIGTDPNSDLALLKIEEKNLPFVKYGNSDDIKVGEWVLAVGNPFNLTSTVTAGIVSAKARELNILSSNYKIESFIQTDAAVNPGNSGGALVNTSGELVGINSAIASNTGSFTGYSFAIPANIVRKVVNDLLEYGEVQRGFIGVSIRDIDSKLANEKGLDQIKGVYVESLTENGSAKDAGIQKGDVITKIGSVNVNSAPELQEQVSRYRPGDKINVTVLRDDKEKVLSVTLKNKKGNTEVVKREVNEIISLLGADFENVPSKDLNRLRIEGGVKVKRLGSGKLRGSGIKEGFIVTRIDRKPIESTDDLVSSLQDKKGAVLIEGVYPNGMSAYYAFGL